MSNGDPVADDGLAPALGEMDDAAVLNRCVAADDDSAHVRAQDCTGPDARPGSNGHAADDVHRQRAERVMQQRDDSTGGEEHVEADGDVNEDQSLSLIHI